MINMSDELILYDGVQFTKNDWRNRNKIKTPLGAQWVTIPVEHHFGQKICETCVCNDTWRQKHWKAIVQNYSKSKYFEYFKPLFVDLYLNSSEMQLSKINFQFIMRINEILGIKTPIKVMNEIDGNVEPTKRLVELCKQASADEYITGPAAKNYLKENLFEQANIKITWMDYSSYPEYDQLFLPFEHSVSIIDLIFNAGIDAHKYLKSFA
jgi:hypothetical protein